MARVTVEDCIVRIPNRFELVMMAAQRARELAGGAQLSVDRDNDKNPVVALREIADATVSLPALKNNLIKGHQRSVEVDEPEEEVIELMAGEQAWAPEVSRAEAEEGGFSEDGLEDDADGDDGLEEPDEAVLMAGDPEEI